MHLLINHKKVKYKLQNCQMQFKLVEVKMMSYLCFYFSLDLIYFIYIF